MLKIIISCGLGMSSSALTGHLQKEISAKGWEDKVQIDFVPFPNLMESQDTLDADIAFLCPHLTYYAKNESKNSIIKIPMYIIPSLMYGQMNLQDIMEDATDLLELNKTNNEKLWHFPEENYLNIKRSISYRKWIANNCRNR